MSSLRHINNFRMPRQPYNYLARTFRDLSETGIDLLGQLLLYDPEKRINAREALKHPWFTEHPLPKATHMMPTFPSTQARRHGCLRRQVVRHGCMRHGPRDGCRT